MSNYKYRYGFEANKERIVSEWLFYVPKLRETRLFERDLDSFKIAKVYQADGVQQRTRANALFLSVSAQFNVEIAEKILKWVTGKLNIVSGLDDQLYLGYTIKSFLDNKNKVEILDLLRKLDLGIDEIRVEQHEFTIDLLPEHLPDEYKKQLVKSSGGKLRSCTILKSLFEKV